MGVCLFLPAGVSIGYLFLLRCRWKRFIVQNSVKGCPEAANDITFYRAVIEACVFWMLDAFHTLPMNKLMKQDYKGVAATARERIIMRAELLVQVIEQFEYLEFIGATMQTILNKFRVLWPEATEIALYPALR